MKAKKKPVLVDVRQLPDPELEELRGSAGLFPYPDEDRVAYNPETQEYWVKSLEGNMTANIGEPKGFIKDCVPEIYHPYLTGTWVIIRCYSTPFRKKIKAEVTIVFYTVTQL